MKLNEKKSAQKDASKRKDDKSNEIDLCELSFSRTLKNLGNTCYVNAALQVIASIPEAVTCIMNLRFEAGNNSVPATMGKLLQQLVPAIASYSAAHSIVIDSGLDQVLLQFVTLSSLQFQRNWRLGQMHDTAEIIKVIFDVIPEISQLFTFMPRETLSCPCQRNPRVRTYIYKQSPLIQHSVQNTSQQNQDIFDQNLIIQQNDVLANSEETKRRLHNHLCCLCIPQIHPKNGSDFFLASDCPQHKSDGLNEGKASYYPVPKIFPCHEIRLDCAANESESKISLSQQIVSKFSAVTSADNVVCQCCGMNGNCFNTTRIIGSPADYLIVTIKALMPTNEGIHAALHEYEILNLKELFADSKADSVVYELHSAVIYRHLHYTTYLHHSQVYINDSTSRHAMPDDKNMVSRYARILFYHLKLPNDAGGAALPVAQVVPSMTVTAALNDELLRIETIIRTKSLADAMYELFGKDTAGIYWADQIQPGECSLCHMFNIPMTADQLRKMRKIPDYSPDYEFYWLDSEMLDIIIGLFLIAGRAENFSADVASIQNTVNCFQTMDKIRVFSCNFVTKICMATDVANCVIHYFRNSRDKIKDDEELWCPANVASTFRSKGTHYIVVETCLWSNSLSVFDSLSIQGAYLDTSYALANEMATAFTPLLLAGNRNSEWTFQIPAQNVPQQPNICDCALHVAARLCFRILGIEYSVSTVQKMRQNMPILILAACKVLRPSQQFNIQVQSQMERYCFYCFFF